MRRVGYIAVAILVLATVAVQAQQQPLVIHEWGTFTALQDETGNAIGHINTDDEPLPGFVHDLTDADLAITDRAVANLRDLRFNKGLPHPAMPSVTMRLETPVVYFYPPRGASLPTTLDLEVSFRGGWLSQFYPDAEVEAPGLHDGVLDRNTIGWLRWRQLQVGTQGRLPETSEKVWLAPRAVRAASVTTAAGESERYLFYRGVGHLEAPLRIVRDEQADRLDVYPQIAAELSSRATLAVPGLWLVEVRPDGRCAFRTHAPVTLGAGSEQPIASLPAALNEWEFSEGCLGGLRRSMHEELVAAGLFDDEAAAMLNTWEVSYFRSPGMRLFFLVPRAWTDHYLPLTVSVPAEMVRVMVGRIELVTPHQRTLIQHITEQPIPTEPSEGTMPVAYRDLGRFREALLLAELSERPTDTLRAFISLHGADRSVVPPGTAP